LVGVCKSLPGEGDIVMPKGSNCFWGLQMPEY